MKVARATRAALVPVAFFLAAPVIAQSVLPSPDGDSAPLERAKRDLEAAKSTRIKEDSTAWRDLRIAVPSAPAPTAPISPASQVRTGRKPGAEPPVRNWLVDSMEKKPVPPVAAEDRRSEKGGRDARRDADFPAAEIGPVTEREPRAADLREPKREERERSGERRKDPDVNPLARYLKDWVSPQDFVLLQSTLSTPAEPGAARPVEYSSSNSSDISAAVFGPRMSDGGLVTRFGGPVQSTETGGARSGVNENPFLQFLTSDGLQARPAVQAPVAPGAGSAATNTTPYFSSPAATPAPRATVPDFVRPIADDKLYRQLKRF